MQRLGNVSASVTLETVKKTTGVQYRVARLIGRALTVVGLGRHGLAGMLDFEPPCCLRSELQQRSCGELSCK